MYKGILSLLLSFSVTPSLTASFSPDRVQLYSITEEVPADTFIANLLIDSGLAAKYSQSIQSKLSFVFLKEIQHLELFSLDERNGILRTGRVIDRDVVCPGQLTCMIRLDLAVQPSAYFEVIKVEVSILDINDNSPTFEEVRFHVVISESAAPFDRFPLPSALDVDSFANGVVEYRLLSATSHFQLEVKNDSMGRPKDVWLVLLKELDREENEHYELLMAAYDGGIPRRSAVLTIAVQVGDVNDNSPKFEKQTYNVSVSENMAIGATVVRLAAVDADIGPNGHVRYRFSQRSEANYGDLFAIDAENGNVVLLQSLNYASQNVYSLGVIAEDQGEYSVPALAALIITVIDINDHAPQIIIDALSASGSVEVRENADVATFVAHVSTFDKDGGDNGLIRCSINNSNFKLIQIYDGEYKLVTARAFDRESVSRYEVVIRCHDMGEPRMFVNKAIIVNIADVNDNHPVFTYSMYNASLQENLSWGSFVVRVSAHDPDEGANGEIAYMLDSDADQRFHIDPDTGVVSTLAGLDREISELVEFHVLAANKGEHNLVSRALIRVHVTDVDDESPTFLSEKYAFDVFENQPARTEVGQVMAVDRDLPPLNAFSFVIRNSKTFAVDPKSGMIYTKRTLDRETEERFEITVEVQSSTVIIKRSVAVVEINVLDTNDNAPNITFPNHVNRTVVVGSMLNVHEVFCTITSHDSDWGVNSELSHEILEGNATNLFGIEPATGQLRLLKELISYVNETFLLLIKVSDGGQPSLYSTAALYVMIVDGHQPSYGGFPRAQNQWLADMRLLIIAGITAICFVLIVLLVVAILLVRRRNSQHRAKTRLAMAMMKNVTAERDEVKEDEDDADSLNRMKMMMNDGKMVRMKDISYTELNSEVPCNVSDFQVFFFQIGSIESSLVALLNKKKKMF